MFVQPLCRLNVGSSFFCLCFLWREVVQHHSPDSSLKIHQVPQETEGCPARLWAAGHAARPCAWPAPSGLGWRSLHQALWERGGPLLVGSTADHQSWRTAVKKGNTSSQYKQMQLQLLIVTFVEVQSTAPRTVWHVGSSSTNQSTWGSKNLTPIQPPKSGIYDFLGIPGTW